MAPLLRRRLVCFYCGRRSPQTLTSGLRRWECENCEAVNHLDANGEITDPPTSEDASSNKRYAQRIQRSVSPVFGAADQTLFCQTCLKNQYLVTQNLADYLPAPNDTRYAEFESKYPEYRKNLEERYPQVCEDCEPRIRERIRETGYAAKTDYLRRMMDKSKGSSTNRARWGNKDTLACAGAAGLLVALAGQLLWNGLGALAVPSDGLRSDDDTTSLTSCILQAVSTSKTESSCDASAYPTATLTMCLGLACLWWNPTMRRRPLERAVGLAEFYKLHFILAFARFVAWYVLGRQAEFQLDQSIVKAIHATMIAFNIAVSSISYRTASIDQSPRISFQEAAQPLLPRKQTGTIAAQGRFDPSPPNSRLSAATHRTVEFPISNLATPPRQVDPLIYHPPTPPPNDDFDAMDIDTPQKNYQLSPSIRNQIPTPQQAEVSPFYGKLPPAPVSKEHKLRNPPNRPSFRKTSSIEQESFANSFKPRCSIKKEEDPDAISPDSPRQMKMEPGRWWSTAANQLTGLESLLETFSTSDEPPELRHTSAHKPQIPPARSSTLGVSTVATRMTNTLLILLSTAIWTLAPTYPLLCTSLRFSSLGIAAATSSLHLLSALSPSLPFWVVSDILVLGLELLVSMALGYQMRQTRLSGESIDEVWGSLPLWYLGFMALQEVAALGMEVKGGKWGTGTKTEENDPVTGNGTQDMRARRPLPIERTLSEASSERGSVCGSTISEESRSTVVRRGTDRRFDNSRPMESPGTSKGLSGLSLGFEDGDRRQESGARTGARDLRSRRVEPWMVGGL